MHSCKFSRQDRCVDVHNVQVMYISERDFVDMSESTVNFECKYTVVPSVCKSGWLFCHYCYILNFLCPRRKENPF